MHYKKAAIDPAFFVIGREYMIVILFGVAGSGKTTIGRQLARQLGWKFYDADQFHSLENREKMEHNIPLTDEDRYPWLEQIRALISACLEHAEPAVLACSALKSAYRRYLHLNNTIKFVYLKGDFPLIRERLEKREGHFAGPELLQSQMDTLEEPQKGEALVIEVSPGPGAIVQSIRRQLGI